MYNPCFEIASFDVLPWSLRADRVRDLVRVLVAINIAYLRAFPNTPLLYHSGVIYRFQEPGADTWQDIPRTLQLGMGTCCDLAAWRVAELLVSGADPHAGPFIKTAPPGTPDGMTTYHVIVKRNGGQFFEDPARLLGMPG